MCAKLPSFLAAGTVALLLSAAPVYAEVLSFTANLIGAAEVPPNEPTGAGTVIAGFDTDTMLFTWTITYEGLSGAATAAHCHGPAGPDENAPPVVPIEGILESPSTGKATLTEEQAADLQAGIWYFNIHTSEYPDGEPRGQLPAFAQAP